MKYLKIPKFTKDGKFYLYLYYIFAYFQKFWGFKLYIANCNTERQVTYPKDRFRSFFQKNLSKYF